jgi:hypothetical protein
VWRTSLVDPKTPDQFDHHRGTSGMTGFYLDRLHRSVGCGRLIGVFRLKLPEASPASEEVVVGGVELFDGELEALRVHPSSTAGSSSIP